MCRQNQLLGWILIAFGAGLLIGCWLSSGFLCFCIGIGAIALGVAIMHRR